MILLSMTIFTFLHLSVLTVKRGAQMAGMNFQTRSGRQQGRTKQLSPKGEYLVKQEQRLLLSYSIRCP